MVYEDFTLLITTQVTGWNKWQHHSNEWKWTSYVRSTLLSSALDCRRWRIIRPDCVHTSSDWETALTTSRSRTDITVAAYQIRLRISTAGRIFPIFTMGREMPSKIAHFRGGILPPHTHLMALCQGLPRWAGTKKVKPIWILLRQETVSGTGSGISWTICKSAPRSRQITTPAPHHSVFLQVGCYSCHPTNSVKALKAKVAGELTAKSCITVATYQIRLRISTAGQILPIFTMGREMPTKISPFRGGILPPHTPI